MMKERTNTKSVAPRKVKGTVLFTVVCVMMVLIVFLMGALALAATANNRAMKNYNEAQTQATAKAGVRAMVSALKNDVSVASAIGSLTKGQKIELDKEKGVNDIQIGFYDGDTENRKMGEITNAKIEYVGNKVVWDENKLQEKAVICFSATAKQGQAESTVSVYMLRGVNGNPPPPVPTPGSGGFVSTGAADSHNHTSTFGGMYVGFDEPQADGLPKEKTNFNPKNGSIYEMPLMVYGSLTDVDGSCKFELVAPSPGNGVTVWGDIDMTKADSELHLVSKNVTSSSMNAKSYRQIPYIFCEGAFKYGGGNCKIGNPDIPLNIFCGSFQLPRKVAMNIYADIFCYKAGETSTLTGETTTLHAWTANVVEPHKTAKYTGTGSYSAGNFYTKGSLKIDGKVVIDGDLYVGETLTLEGSSTLTVNGNCTIAGDPSSTYNKGTVKFPEAYEYDKITGTDPNYKIVSKASEVLAGTINPFASSTLITSVPSPYDAECSANQFEFGASGSDFTVNGNKMIYNGSYDNLDATQKAYVNSIKDVIEYNSTAKEIIIHKSCTISGKVNNGCAQHVVFAPGANETIWVKIAGGSETINGDGGKSWSNAFCADNGVNFIVKDANGSTVNFLIAGNCVIKGKDNLGIWTEKMANAFAGSTNRGFEVTDLDPVSVNIYSETGDAHGKPWLFDMGDGANIFAANIRAPYMDLKHNAGSPDVYAHAENKSTEPDKRFNITYNGYELRQDGTFAGSTETINSKGFGKSVALFGCCIINDLVSQNDWELLYVPYGGGGPGPSPSPVEEDALMQGWKTLYYENY